MRPARLAADALLSCTLALALAPAQAHQPAPRHPPHPCASGQSCPAASAAARPRPGARQTAECALLRAAIMESEHPARRASGEMMEAVQQDLSILRRRYRKLGCATAARA
ncbi:hypothetical protein IM543_18340 [Massilia sp. UMI-21]|nr:hypothetical protein IM543_18340 [Massilia sp. UMI-21]